MKGRPPTPSAPPETAAAAARVKAAVDKVITALLSGDAEPARGAADLARGAGLDDIVEVLLPHLRDGAPGARDAAASLLEELGERPGAAPLFLERARRLDRNDHGRLHLLLTVGELEPETLTADERDEVALAPIRLMASEAAGSAQQATEMAARWRSLDDEHRELLLAGIETALDGLPDALPLAVVVLEVEHDPARRRRLVQLVAGSRHPEVRTVLERLAVLGDKTESLGARRALLSLTPPPDGPAPQPLPPVAALTGIDGFGRFEVALGTPRFDEVLELVVLRIDLDTSRPVDSVHTAFADRSELDDFIADVREGGGIVSLVNPGEAVEIIYKAIGRADERSGARLEGALEACSRAARAVTRRLMLPPPIGDSSEGLERHPAFAQVGLPLAGEARKVVLDALEELLPRAGRSEAKLEALVLELAETLARRFDGPELRKRASARALHQAAVLMSAGEDELCGRAAFLARQLQAQPAGDSPCLVRMIASAILAEIRSAASEPDEAALRRALRERFFATDRPPDRQDLQTLDLLEVMAEALRDRELDLPEEAPAAARAVVVAVGSALRAQAPATPRRLELIGVPTVAVLDETQLGAVVEAALVDGLPGMDRATIATLTQELTFFLLQLCLSRCPHRCFGPEPRGNPAALFGAEAHPSTVTTDG